MKILVTGGTGYIGSHTCVELIKDGYDVVIVDNFSNSSKEVLTYIEQISNVKPHFYEGDICKKEIVEQIFKENEIDAVIHFAGFKAVGESVENPLKYYQNNLISTITLLEVMKENNCKRLVFSSSATVYGDPEFLPIKETSKLQTTNPYGTTKLMIEQILRDLANSDSEYSIALLRYFNPIGAHESGLIGENPNDIPNNLMPFIVKVANKELKELTVFGDSYNTPDGTGVRDYIHVVDLSKGHIKAIEFIMKHQGIDAYNLGTGIGYSVLEVAKTFEEVNQIKVPYRIGPKRDGDIAACYADPKYAEKMLNWKTTKDLKTMCKDAYRFVKNNKK